jgi:hypothetical protein
VLESDLHEIYIILKCLVRKMANFSLAKFLFTLHFFLPHDFFFVKKLIGILWIMFFYEKQDGENK